MTPLGSACTQSTIPSLKDHCIGPSQNPTRNPFRTLPYDCASENIKRSRCVPMDRSLLSIWEFSERVMDSMVSLYLSECSFAPGAVVELRTREDAKVVARSPNRRTSSVRLADRSLPRVLTHNVRQAAGTDPPSLPLVQYVCPVVQV
jgi:hypothetical protein